MPTKPIRSDETICELIENKIIDFNNTQVPFTQKKIFSNLNFHIKDEHNQVIAGINALMYCWGIVYIDVLFVDETHRGKRLGSQLLNKIELEAKKKGATLIHLDTFDWQAKDFYLKNGYQTFGILSHCPAEHHRYFMHKQLLPYDARTIKL